MIDAAFIEVGQIYNVADDDGGVSPILIVSLEEGRLVNNDNCDVWVYWDIRKEIFNWFPYGDPFFLLRLMLVKDEVIINGLVKHMDGRILSDYKRTSNWTERYIDMIGKMKNHA